ncbi:MAG: DNA repair protein RecO [Lachnospiraceae bacterium]|nr:DNA repair protein RecO [Lachnospiraceae bacterium]
MSDYIEMTGMVLKATPVSDNDKRIVLLTAERGKVTVFARGARKPTSRFMAATNPLCMGRFKLFEGKNAYNLGDTQIDHYFEQLRDDFESAMYGMYFADMIDYFCRENLGAADELNLLYVSLKALLREEIPNRLIRCVFEMKLLVFEGIFPGITTERKLSDTARHVITHCMESPLKSLYSFTVSSDVIAELELECEHYAKRCIGHHFQSLDILKTAIGE